MKQIIDFDLPKIKVFDFHRHMSNLNDFNENLNQFNIDKFCIMPSMIENDFNEISAYIENIKPYIQEYNSKTKVFGILDFNESYDENISLLEHQKKELKIKGIKIHPKQGFKIDKLFLEPFFKAITEVLGTGIPIYIHMDWPLREENRFAPAGKKSTFNKIASLFPEFNFIMGHAGGSGDYLRIWKSCKKFSNVYVETSMAPVTSTLSEVVWKVGPERILFGSNYPYCGTSIELIKVLSIYKVSEEDKRAILESNWEVLFSK